MGVTKLRQAQLDFTGGIPLPANTITTPNMSTPAGTLKTSPAAGDYEFASNLFYQTPVTGNRGVTGIIHLTTNNADFTGGNVTTAQPIFQAANDVLTVPATTTYWFQLFLSVTNGVTTTTKGLSFGGTATLSSIRYRAIGQNTAINTTSTTILAIHADTAANTVVLATGTTSWWIEATGIVRISTTGTFIPQFQFSAAPGTTVLIKKDTYMILIPIGSNTVASVGAWT